MKKITIGRTNISVCAIGLGTMPLSIQNRPTEQEALRVIHAALDAGVDFIDTANVYCLDNTDIGHNEKLIAKALKTWPGSRDIYVATKGGLTRPEGNWEVSGAPNKLREACEQSLRDLGVEEIFLYQLHAPDERYSLADQIAMLAKLQEEGKIRHIGISNMNLPELLEAQAVARIETLQNKFNPGCKDDQEGDVFDGCIKHDMTYIAYSPVGGGTHEKLAKKQVICDIAQRYGVSSYQIILAWCLAQGDFILPIPGASKINSILDSIQAASLKLDARDIALVDNLKF
jgi:aryl-alcohol dehydrogenase-like predicted oxidoreductase